MSHFSFYSENGALRFIPFVLLLWICLMELFWGEGKYLISYFNLYQMLARMLQKTTGFNENVTILYTIPCSTYHTSTDCNS